VVLSTEESAISTFFSRQALPCLTIVLYETDVPKHEAEVSWIVAETS